MKDLRITFIQTKLFWENPHQNLILFTELLNKIKNGSTDVILLPEMFSTGFTMHATTFAEDSHGPTLKWMKKTAKEKRAILCGSLIVKENDLFFNRLIWMRPDGTFDTYDKRHLFRMSNEQLTYSAGTKKLIVEHKGWKICPLICYDLRFPVWSRRTENENYDLLLYVANWPHRRNHPWKQLLIARAIENQSYVAGVNRIGSDGNGITHSGDSAVIDPMGIKLSKTKASQHSIETVVLSARLLTNWRNQLKAGLDADVFTIKK